MGAERGRLRLVENRVIRLTEGETAQNLRVLSCRPGTTDVILFDIGDELAFPEWVLSERLQALFEKGVLEPLADDPGGSHAAVGSILSSPFEPSTIRPIVAMVTKMKRPTMVSAEKSCAVRSLLSLMKTQTPASGTRIEAARTT